MRVVSGSYRGRTLKAVPGKQTRPTTDKIKESIFNIIGPYFDGGVMLDLYAGSGGMAIEAVSRGMNHAFLCEKNRQALQTIRANIEMTKEIEKFTIVGGDSKKSIHQLSKLEPFEPFELVFIDPPYHLQEIEQDILSMIEQGVLSKEATIVCEVEKQTQLPEIIGEFELVKRVEYGITAIHIYR